MDQLTEQSSGNEQQPKAEQPKASDNQPQPLAEQAQVVVGEQPKPENKSEDKEAVGKLVQDLTDALNNLKTLQENVSTLLTTCSKTQKKISGQLAYLIKVSDKAKSTSTELLGRDEELQKRLLRVSEAEERLHREYEATRTRFVERDSEVDGQLNTINDRIKQLDTHQRHLKDQVSAAKSIIGHDLRRLEDDLNNLPKQLLGVLQLAASVGTTTK